MTNNNRNYNNGRNIRRGSDRARAITKAKAKRQNIIIGCAAFALVAVTAASFLIYGAFAPKTSTVSTTPTTISMKKDDNKAAQPAKQISSQTATQAVQDTQTEQTLEQSAQNTESTQQAQTADNTQQEKKSEDKIETINGERVYIDTKRPVPEGSGTPAHYYANGKTSYGFNWDYSGGGNFYIRVDYNFDQQQYDFQFYGTAPGTSTTTIYYFTDDNTKVPVDLTVTVDDNLNVSIS